MNYNYGGPQVQEEMFLNKYIMQQKYFYIENNSFVIEKKTFGAKCL